MQSVLRSSQLISKITIPLMCIDQFSMQLSFIISRWAWLVKEKIPSYLFRVYAICKQPVVCTMFGIFHACRTIGSVHYVIRLYTKHLSTGVLLMWGTEEPLPTPRSRAQSSWSGTSTRPVVTDTLSVTTWGR
jgi:hypothetical protein